MTDFDKLVIAYRYWLMGRAAENKSFFTPLDALEYGMSIHTGKRKNGQDPEFLHQIQIAHYLRTLHSNLRYPADTFTVIALHDTPEDYAIDFDYLEDRFGKRPIHSVRLVTKKYRGIALDTDKRAFFGAMAEDAIASAVKGGDRINNMGSMAGVFSVEKQELYCDEVRDLFLPMLKTARRNFPDQEPIYENIKMVLNTQLTMVEAMLKAKKASG